VWITGDAQNEEPGDDDSEVEVDAAEAAEDAVANLKLRQNQNLISIVGCGHQFIETWEGESVTSEPVTVTCDNCYELLDWDD
jgi:hypothetical protein